MSEAEKKLKETIEILNKTIEKNDEIIKLQQENIELLNKKIISLENDLEDQEKFYIKLMEMNLAEAFLKIKNVSIEIDLDRKISMAKQVV